MTELHELSLLEAATALRAGDVSSVELTRACLHRIASIDDQVHAFLAVTEELAMEQAAAADVRLGSEDDPPTMLGVPIAVKDVLCVKGAPATCASRILEGFYPPYNATSVARLLDDGAVVVGKTNTDEFAMGSSTENSGYGTTHNPWDLSRVPGGSSGGSAAAVASGMCFAALGTDTGGSVRQPASLCGVAGLKTSYGRVSRYGLIAFASSLDTVGVLARSAADAAPVYQSMAGHDPLDSTTMPEPVPAFHLNGASLDGLKVGVPAEYFIEGVSPEVETAVRAAIDVLAGMGAELRELSMPHTDLALPVYYLIAPAEASANLARYDGIRFGPRLGPGVYPDDYFVTRGELFGREVKRRVMLGTYALSAGYYDAYYGQAQKVRTLIKDDFDAAFEQVDLIACPTTPTTAFVIGTHSGDPLAMYLEDALTLPGSLAGVPGLSVPVGLDEAGLPIGMQLLGPHLAETAVFEAAHAYQTATSFHTERPAL